MNDTQLLERLTTAYETVDAPVPSAALLRLMDAGGAVADDGDARDAVVIPFAAPRPRMRMRYLVAAMVASFVALSGLAAAGALPDSIQHGVSSVVSHLGIDLPNPQPSHGDAPVPARTPTGGVSTTLPSASTTTPAAGGAPTTTPSGSTGLQTTGPGATPTTLPDGGVLGGVGDLGGGTGPTDTTLPGSGGGAGLPPVTLPPISLPPIGVPGLPLPPISLPPITLPPITLNLPLLGL
jgi:hypothetical protein